MFFPVASFSSAENITLRHDDVIYVLILRHAKRANGRGVILGPWMRLNCSLRDTFTSSDTIHFTSRDMGYCVQ